MLKTPALWALPSRKRLQKIQPLPIALLSQRQATPAWVARGAGKEVATVEVRVAVTAVVGAVTAVAVGIVEWQAALL